MHARTLPHHCLCGERCTARAVCVHRTFAFSSSSARLAASTSSTARRRASSFSAFLRSLHSQPARGGEGRKRRACLHRSMRAHHCGVHAGFMVRSSVQLQHQPRGLQAWGLEGLQDSRRTHAAALLHDGVHGVHAHGVHAHAVHAVHAWRRTAPCGPPPSCASRAGRPCTRPPQTRAAAAPPPSCPSHVACYCCCAAVAVEGRQHRVNQ